MPKVQTIKFKLRGVDHQVHINVSSGGTFSANIPQVIADALKLKERIEDKTLKPVADTINNAISRFKEAKTTEEVFIAIQYGAGGKFADGKKGGGLWSGQSDFDIRLDWDHDNTSCLAFDFKVVVLVTTDGVKSYHDGILGKDKHWYDDEPALIPDKWYPESVLYEEFGKAHSKWRLIPYTEQSRVALETAMEKLRTVSEMLYKFMKQSPKKIEETLASSQKLLS